MYKDFNDKLKRVMVEKAETEIHAFLGNLFTGEVEVSGKPTYVYATIAWVGKVIKVKNSKVPNRLRLPVTIGYAKGSGERQVLGIWHVYKNLDIPEVAHHDHTLGTSDNPAWIKKAQILELLPAPTTGMIVKVGGGYYSINRSVFGFSETEFDMTTFIPATGARWVNVVIDETKTIDYLLGELVDNRFMLDFSLIPETPNNQYSLFSCKVYAGQTRLAYGVSDSDVFDPRFIQTAGKTFFTYWEDLLNVPAVFPPDPDDPAFEEYTGRTVSVSDPLINDDANDGYRVLHLWFNSTTGKVFVLKDNTVGAAVWEVIGAGGAGDITWSVDGALAVSDPCAVPYLITKDTTLAFVFIRPENPGTAGSTSVDILLNGGTSILSAPISVDWDDADGWAKVVPVVVDLVEGDYLTPKITAVATGASGLIISVVPESAGGGGGGGAFNLTVTDGTTTVFNVEQIDFEGSIVTDMTGGVVKVSKNPAVIDPLDITGCALLLRADSLTTNVDGDLIQDWIDESASGNDASQATSGARPIFREKVFNGYPGLLFNGPHYMELASNIDLANSTVFVVHNTYYKPGYATLFSMKRFGIYSLVNTLQWGIWRNAQLGGGEVFLSDAGIACVTFASGTTNLYSNGRVRPETGGSDTAATATRIGWDSTGSQTHLGYIAEIIVYDTVLSVTDRQAVERYLSVKYDIKVAGVQ